MIASGSYVLVSASGQVTSLLAGTSADVASAIAQTLASDGTLTSVGVDITPVLETFWDALTSLQWLNYPYQVRVTVRTNVDFATVDDAASIIGHTLYVVCGTYPETLNSSLAQQPTIAPIASSPWLFSSIGNAVSNVASGVQGDVRLVLYGVLAIVALVILLLVFSPDAKKLAGIAAL